MSGDFNFSIVMNPHLHRLAERTDMQIWFIFTCPFEAFLSSTLFQLAYVLEKMVFRIEATTSQIERTTKTHFKRSLDPLLNVYEFFARLVFSSPLNVKHLLIICFNLKVASFKHFLTRSIFSLHAYELNFLIQILWRK